MAKKSAPRIGLVTSAMMNSCQNSLSPNLRWMLRLPNVLMPVPFAAARGVSAGLLLSSAEAGKTEISAPVSAKYGRRLASQMVKVRLLSLPFTEHTDKGR